MTTKYNTTVILGGKKYVGEGGTVAEALSKVKLGIAHGSSVLVVSKGKKSKQRILNKLQTNRIFKSQGLMRTVQIKNTSLLFDSI